jgi:hypothetical protein
MTTATATNSAADAARRQQQVNRAQNLRESGQFGGAAANVDQVEKPAARVPSAADAAAVADNASAVNDVRGPAGQALLDTKGARAAEPALPKNPAAEAAKATDAIYARAADDAKAIAGMTEGLSEDQKFDLYSNMVTDNGGAVKTGANERNMVAIRVPTDADENDGKGVYDDRMAMFWKDDAGKKHVREYTGNTEPIARYRGREGEDADGNGTLDQGRLPSGQTFQYAYESKAKQLRPTAPIDAERDTNADGKFGNDNGATHTEKMSMLIHTGSRNATDSAGCQTMPPDDYKRFLGDLKGMNGTLGYTVVDAHMNAPVTTEC